MIRKRYTIVKEVMGTIFYWTGCRWSPFREHAEVYRLLAVAKMDIQAGRMVGAEVKVFF